MLEEIIDWTVQNGPQIATTVLAVIGAASAIARLTPTQKDHNVVAKVQKVPNWIIHLIIPDLKVDSRTGKVKKKK